MYVCTLYGCIYTLHKADVVDKAQVAMYIQLTWWDVPPSSIELVHTHGCDPYILLSGSSTLYPYRLRKANEAFPLKMYRILAGSYSDSICQCISTSMQPQGFCRYKD